MNPRLDVFRNTPASMPVRNQSDIVINLLEYEGNQCYSAFRSLTTPENAQVLLLTCTEYVDEDYVAFRMC